MDDNEIDAQWQGTCLEQPEILTQCQICGKVGPVGDIITLWLGDEPTPDNPTADTTICIECLDKRNSPSNSKEQTKEKHNTGAKIENE